MNLLVVVGIGLVNVLFLINKFEILLFFCYKIKLLKKIIYYIYIYIL